jgi:hypothetical protein
MRLEELQQTILGSSPADWHPVDAGGPTLLDAFSQAKRWDGGVEVNWLEHTYHHTRVVYKPNVEIGMAWGMPRDLDDTPFHEDWVEHFPDERATAAWLDLLHGGEPVDRRLYVVVDGGRCKIPLPGQIFARDLQSREVRRFISNEEYRLLKLVNELDNGYDYEGYLDRTGLDVNRD